MTIAPIRKLMPRKPPTKRLFSGMVGRPPDEPAQEAPPAPTLPPLIMDSTQKRAQAARDRRKRNAEQLDAIKKALRTPITEIKKAAEEQARLDKEAKVLGSMNRGKWMTDAPTGMGELVLTGGSKEMELVAGARGRAAALGSPKSNPQTGTAFWPENDRGRIVPEGTGPGDREDDTDASGSKFRVKLNDFDSDGLFQELFHIYFVRIEPGELDDLNTGNLVCSLCKRRFYWERRCKAHIEAVHGDEREPEHDSRYGNVIYKYLKCGRKMPNIKKAIKKAKREVTA